MADARLAAVLAALLAASRCTRWVETKDYGVFRLTKNHVRYTLKWDGGNTQ
jgi:hypothetical protein